MSLVSDGSLMSKYGLCPSCNSRDVRVSEARNVKERVLEWVGICQLRCRACRLRYQGSLWQPRNVLYARCPKCFRMELSTWSEQYYNPSLRTVLALRLGATPYRCEFCRCNFASWRACKERFLWRKQRRAGAATRSQEAPPDSGQAPDSSDSITPAHLSSSKTR